MGSSKKAARKRTVKVKKKCCTSNPRCRKCPIVLGRLTKLGYAEKVEGEKRTYQLAGKVPASVVKALRRK